MNNLLDFVKYLVYGMVIYVLFSYVPKNKLPVSDIMVITIVVMMTYMLLDFVSPSNTQENFMDSVNTNENYAVIGQNEDSEVDTENLLDSEQIVAEEEEPPIMTQKQTREDDLLSKIESQDEKIKNLEKKLAGKKCSKETDNTPMLENLLKNGTISDEEYNELKRFL